MKRKGLLISSSFVVLSLMILVFYTGYVRTYLDDEAQTTFFVKKYPTLKMRFFDPFANEGDDVPVERLSGAARAEFSDYCKFRLGISTDDDVSLKRCKEGIPKYLK